MAFEQILRRENFETVVEIREFHIEKGEFGTHLESLADNNSYEKREGDKKEQEGESLHADRDKEAEEATREREGGSSIGEEKGLKERSAEYSDTSRVEKERGREEEEARAEEVERTRLEAVNNYRAQAMQNRMDSIPSAQQKAKQAASDHHDEELSGGDAAKKNTQRKKENPKRESKAKSVVNNQVFLKTNIF